MATDLQVAALKLGAKRLENLHFLSLRSCAQYNTSFLLLTSTALGKLNVLTGFPCIRIIINAAKPAVMYL
jgi:hypothetical protein